MSLPVYLVIGAAGCGKSSLLSRAGLDLGTPATIAGATWWAGEDAIFVENAVGTSGQNLRRVCEIVTSLRPTLPVNGILFVLSPADLTLADQGESREFAESASQALRKIKIATAQTIPIYMLLSKIDLLPGFREFFERQDPQERMQPWGFMVPSAGLSEAAAHDMQKEGIDRGFRQLLTAVCARQIEFLSREADPVRNARINGFGAQVAALQTTIQPVLDILFGGGGRTSQSAVVRGMFLTSARQEGLSIDGFLPELSRRFVMPRVGMLPPDLGLEDEEHGYFVSGAFKDNILKEAGLATAARRGRFGALQRWGAVIILAGVCAFIGYLLLQTFSLEVHHATHSANVANTLPKIASPTTTAVIPSILNALRQLDDLASSLDDDEMPSDYLVGLAARVDIEAAVAEARDRYRNNALRPSLIALLENRLVNIDAAVKTLKADIALADVLDHSIDSVTLTAWLEAEAALLPEADRALFIRESRAALQAGGGIVVDSAYIEAARRILAYKESLH
jgi:type VI protein secretion system component VasK